MKYLLILLTCVACAKAAPIAPVVAKSATTADVVVLAVDSTATLAGDVTGLVNLAVAVTE